jgi:hypothetical protein
MFMLMMVLDDVSRLNEVLSAWEAAGVRGVTILESTGLARVLERHHPRAAYVGFSGLFGGGRVSHNTLIAVIDDMAQAEAAAAATEAVVGALHEPHTGILFVLPVLRAWGVGQANPEAGAG